MINVIVNAYAISPKWGSEQGMGWHWVTSLARFCCLDVITEEEFREDIEAALPSLPHAKNITMHYLPVTPEVRRMCWNQGDWRFYGHYRKWQMRALAKAREIMGAKHVDIIHQLNMVGFREPGYLWKIKDVPFVWGPVGGMELLPTAYLKGAGLKQHAFNLLKNTINRLQYTYSPRVRSAIRRADAIVSAVKGVQDVLGRLYNKESVHINETGVQTDSRFCRKNSRSERAPLKIIWVGKFDFRKQLPLAIRAVSEANLRDFEFHICGSGSDKAIDDAISLARQSGINDCCHWHGSVANEDVKRMMAESDIMLFTSIMEATSTVVLEAISVGLPVLCFNTCGFGPIVRDFAGVTVEISDPERSVKDFASELRRLDESRELLDEISAREIRRRKELSWEAKAERMVEIYREVLGERGAQG